MKGIKRLFPWIVSCVGILLFNFGLMGIIGGIIMVIGTMIYLYKNDRKTEFKIICLMFGVLLIMGIAGNLLYANVIHSSTTTMNMLN